MSAMATDGRPPEECTYTFRDAAGYVTSGTDDLAEAVGEIDRLEKQGDTVALDDFDPVDLRKQHRAATRDADRAEREAAKAAKKQQAAIEDRATELAADPQALARAVAEMEVRLGG